MSTPDTPVGQAERGRTRWALWLVLLLLLLLLTSCAAYAAGRGGTDGGDQVGATPAPTVTVTAPAIEVVPGVRPRPIPTVTITVPADGDSGSSGDGSGSGNGSGTGSGTGNGSGGVTGGVGGSGSGTVSGDQARDFRLSSTALGGPLFPGAPGQLRVVITNPNPTTLTVRTIGVTVKTPSPSTCKSAWFTVGDYDASTDPALTVAPNGSSVLLLPIELIDLPTTNQNACQGATIPLSLSGTGRLG